jgi:ABC-2 type transport system ATP-binding protein
LRSATLKAFWRSIEGTGMADIEAMIIETKALTKRFGDFTAVDQVNLNVGAGEIFGLIGPNGAGKSTLIKMLTTLLPPSSGSATIAGFDLAKQPQKIRAHIGYVPQLLSADGALSGYENLLLSARLYLVPRGERPARIALEIAHSMIHEPAILFMDEPTVGLDPVARQTVWDHVRGLRDRLATTILLTTHAMEQADELCDRIGILHAGRLETVAAPAALKAAVGPGATLDDVFARVAGTETEAGGSYRAVREARRSARAHS